MVVTIQIRKFKVTDLLAVLELFDPNKLSAYSASLDAGGGQINELEGSGYVMVLEKTGEVVGYCQAVIFERVTGFRVATIEDVVVHKDFRNLGYGSNLVVQVIKSLQLNGVTKVLLACDEELVQWYSVLGFLENGVSMKIYL